MRIMLDTNILISMLLFPNEQFRKILDYITRNHKLVLSSFIIDELTAVVARKFPKKIYVVDSFLSDLSYELVYTPRACLKNHSRDLHSPLSGESIPNLINIARYAS